MPHQYHLFCNKCAVFFFFINISNLILNQTSNALTITPPTSLQDWKDLSALLCDTFDAPSKDPTISSSSSVTKLSIEELKWNLYERQFTIQDIYKRYTRTARKLKGTKYNLFLAKQDYATEMDSNMEEIVGVVELGMTLANEVENNPPNSKRKARATIGVLCVKEEYQGQGIGSALVSKCQERAKDVWMEDEIYVEVEPSNKNALAFFHSCGYQETSPIEIKNATVSRRRQMESRPHWVLSQYLINENDFLCKDGEEKASTQLEKTET